MKAFWASWCIDIPKANCVAKKTKQTCGKKCLTGLCGCYWHRASIASIVSTLLRAFCILFCWFVWHHHHEATLVFRPFYQGKWMRCNSYVNVKLKIDAFVRKFMCFVYALTSFSFKQFLWGQRNLQLHLTIDAKYILVWITLYLFYIKLSVESLKY